MYFAASTNGRGRVPGVPLNEDEQRILSEIERQFHADDPESARRIGSTGLREYLVRNCRWAAVGLIVGLVILVAAFSSSWLLGIFGFLLMLVSAFVLIQNLRRISRLRIDAATRAAGVHSLGELLEDFGRRLRRRFGDDE
jgi:hypothetical protein